MHKMTEKNLKDAFAGESMAYMKYHNFSSIAEKEGFKNVARLFRAIAFAEVVHASNHMKALGLMKKSSENLVTAIDGENYEVNEMYPAFKAVADLQEEKKAQVSFKYALDAEKIHEKMYKDTKVKVDEGKDIELGPVYICDNCGYTVENGAPDYCPICGVKKDRFVEFD